MATTSFSFSLVSAPDDKKGSNFIISLDFGDSHWIISRRYADFEKFYEKIGKQLMGTDLTLTTPPKKKLFGKTDGQMNRRRAWIDSLLQQLLSSHSAIRLSLVRDFLGLTGLDLDSRPNGMCTATDLTRVEETVADDDQASVETKINLGPSERPSTRPSHFDFLKTVGKGSFGKVYLARHKGDGHIYAMKVLAKTHVKKCNEVKHVMSERNVLISNIRHPFLVSLHYSFQTKDKLYFVLDYLNGGELFFHLQRDKYFSENRARLYAAEIGSALGYLHENNIIYRDLKPENLLLDSTGHVVLTDFGMCKEGIKHKDLTDTFCGTLEYMAPEVILKRQYDRTVDWWCLGSVLYEMLFGLPPFYSKDRKEMYEKIVHQQFRVSRMVSPGAKSLLLSMLEKDRTKRLGAKRDFLELKEHPFFMAIEWEKLLRREIKPPFVPPVQNPLDTTNIDPQFTSIQPTASLIPANSYIGSADRDFPGFTYVPQAEIS